MLSYTACSVKAVAVKVPKVKKNHKLDKIEQKITENCGNSLVIKNYNSYIKLGLNSNNDFRKGSYVLKMEAKEKLMCIADVLKNQNKLFIVITGHANDSNDNHKNQNLSDNRAISVAELFFNLGIRDEMFAKGCSFKIPLTQREVKLYIYSNKSNIQNHCR
jgi:outer membrane protein OmpA-like peptidoglycan-associated protein